MVKPRSCLAEKVVSFEKGYFVICAQVMLAKKLWDGIPGDKSTHG